MGEGLERFRAKAAWPPFETSNRILEWRERRTTVNPLRAASAQFEHVNGDPAANLAIMEDFVHQAAEQEVRLLLFPECCLTGYWFLRHLSRKELTALAEPLADGPSVRRIKAMAAGSGAIVSAGLIELGEEGRLYNTQIAALPDGTVYRHRKLHAFISEHIDSGSEYLVFPTPWGWKAGILICYDNNIVENARAIALMGADVLLAPHQTGGCDSVSPHGMKRIPRALWDNRHEDPEAIEKEFCGPNGRGWLMRWLPSRAHDNGMFIVFGNGVGVDDDEVRTGNAMILDPYGRILVETWKAGNNMVVADLDPDLLALCTGRRWIKARRPELYGPLTQRTGGELDIRSVRFGGGSAVSRP